MRVTKAGPHGGDGRVLAAALGTDPSTVLDLSASCNPFAPDPGPVVAAHLRAGALSRYPDAVDEVRATGALAEAIGVDPGRLLVTNGGAEAIALVAAELGRGWVDEPDFSLYRRHLARLDPEGPRFRSDPHNPTGLLASDSVSAEAWDEAFYPLATGRWSRVSRPGAPPWAPRDRPAVVVGSLTKVLNCPGLRLGYVVVPEDGGEALGHPDMRRRLADRQPRWSVSTPALAALPELLARADLRGWSRAIAAARESLVGVLAAYGLAARPSDANFVLVDGASGMRERLASSGVVVRDCASFGLPGTLRIAVPGPDGLARLDAALGVAREQAR
jgi:histidinol-phosphate/aromatic aminotransferase/cobyric acid decarboxylase-like protein